MTTIVKDAQNVIDAAEKIIAHIKNVLKEKTISIVMNTVFRFSFRRGFYRMNKQETIEYINKQDASGNYGCLRYARDDLGKARKLLLIAKHGNSVTLNCENVQVLYGN